MLEIARLQSPILSHVVEFVKLCHKDAKERDPWMYKYHRYLTLQSCIVKKGDSQRANYWHCDNPEEPDMPVYYVVEGEPTEFKSGKTKPNVIYRLTREDIHRSPRVKRTHKRTFMRIAYSRRMYSYTLETNDLNMMVLA